MLMSWLIAFPLGSTLVMIKLMEGLSSSQQTRSSVSFQGIWLRFHHFIIGRNSEALLSEGLAGGARQAGLSLVW